MRLAGAGASRVRSGYLRALLTGQLALAATAAAQLIAVPFQIEIAGVEGFGIVSLTVTGLGIAGMGVGWLTNGGVRRLGETRAVWDESGYAAAQLVVRYGLMLYGVVLALLAVAVGLALESSVPPPLAAQWHVALGAIALMAFLQYEQAGLVVELTANQRQAACNVASFVQNAVAVSVLVLVWLQGWRGLLPIFSSIAMGFVGSRIVLTLAARTGHRWSYPQKCQGSWREGLRGLFNRRGGGYTLYNALTHLQQADVVLVGWLGGAYAAGQFSAVWRIPSLIIQVFWRVPAYLEPYVIEAHARGDQERRRWWYRRGERVYIAAAAVVALGFALFGHNIVQLWLGSAIPGEPWQYWIAGGAVFWLTTIRWPINFLHAEARLRGLLMWQGIEIAARMLLTVVLFSAIGIAAPWAAAIFVVGILSFWKYRSLAKR